MALQVLPLQVSLIDSDQRLPLSFPITVTPLASITQLFELIDGSLCRFFPGALLVPPALGPGRPWLELVFGAGVLRSVQLLLELTPLSHARMQLPGDGGDDYESV